MPAQQDAIDIDAELRGARERLEPLRSPGSGFALTPEDKGSLRVALRALDDLERIWSTNRAGQGAASPSYLQVAKIDLVSLAVTTRELRQARGFYQAKEERQDEAVGSFVRACTDLERVSGALASRTTEALASTAVPAPSYNFTGLALFAIVVFVALFAAFAKPGK